MKNKQMLLFPIVIGITTFAIAEVQVSRQDKDGNIDYIYIDKNSQIINSTIGTTININRSTPRTKEESIIYYNKRIDYYNGKIDAFHMKISSYEEKIRNKPKYQERYKNKIEKYFQKIDTYKSRIRTTQLKITELK